MASEQDIVTPEHFDLIERLGQEYHAALLPSDLKRWPVGSCYDASAIQAVMNRKYTYVEGIAQTTNGWVCHAWLTDGLHAFDPTWYAYKEKDTEVPYPGRYFGIPIDLADLGEFMSATGYQGIFPNSWRAPEIAKRIIVKREKELGV